MKDGENFDHTAGEFTHTVTVVKRDGRWGVDIDGHPEWSIGADKADDAAQAARDFIDTGMPGRGTFA